jgi:Sel1 repeat
VRCWLIILLAIALTPASSALAQEDEEFSPALLAKAKAGNAVAQNELAIAYSEGLGVKPNQRTAVYWFRKSAEQGYAYGACNLGRHYGWGAGVRKDYVQALKWALVANSLHGLRCHPRDFVEAFKIGECQIEEAWALAVAWLRAHPKLENLDFGGKPWMKDDGEYGAQLQLPVKPSENCQPRRKTRRAARRSLQALTVPPRSAYKAGHDK